MMNRSLKLTNHVFVVGLCLPPTLFFALALITVYALVTNSNPLTHPTVPLTISLVCFFISYAKRHDAINIIESFYKEDLLKVKRTSMYPIVKKALGYSVILCVVYFTLIYKIEIKNPTLTMILTEGGYIVLAFAALGLIIFADAILNLSYSIVKGSGNLLRYKLTPQDILCRVDILNSLIQRHTENPTIITPQDYENAKTQYTEISKLVAESPMHKTMDTIRIPMNYYETRMVVNNL